MYNVRVPMFVYCNGTNTPLHVMWVIDFLLNLDFAHLTSPGGKVSKPVKFISENNYYSITTMLSQNNLSCLFGNLSGVFSYLFY